jgi:hypothetical protein
MRCSSTGNSSGKNSSNNSSDVSSISCINNSSNSNSILPPCHISMRICHDHGVDDLIRSQKRIDSIEHARITLFRATRQLLLCAVAPA